MRARFLGGASREAQQTSIAPNQSTIDPTLAAQAKITLDSARIIALKKVPHGSVASEELERENGHLIYSFDVKVPGKSGIQEVNVNALTGKVLGVHHEGPATERKEARADSAAAHKRWRIARVALIVARELSNESNPPTDAPSAKAGVGLFVALAATGLLLWGFAALADGFNETGRIARLDLAVLDRLQHHGTESGESVFVFVSWLGAPVLVMMDVAVAAWLALRRKWRWFALWTIAIVGGLLLDENAQARISSCTPFRGFGIHHEELVELSQWSCNELAGGLCDARVPAARARHEHRRAHGRCNRRGHSHRGHRLQPTLPRRTLPERCHRRISRGQRVGDLVRDGRAIRDRPHALAERRASVRDREEPAPDHRAARGTSAGSRRRVRCRRGPYSG